VAWTITRIVGYHGSANSHIFKIGQLTGPNPYTVGGEPLTPAQLGMSRIDVLLLEPLTDGTDILLGEYEVAAQTIKVYDGTFAEVGAVNLSGRNARFIAFGV